MAKESGFSNEPKLPGAKEPKLPAPAKRVPKAVGTTPPATPPPPSIAAPPARGSGSAWESDVWPARVVTPLPPDAYTPGPPAKSDPPLGWLTRVPLFIGIVGLPIYGIVYGIRALRAARRGEPANTKMGILALTLGGGVVLAVLGTALVVALEPGESRDPADLVVGDCVTDKGLASDSTTDVPSVRVIDCEEPHFGQVFYVSRLVAGAYPGEPAIITRVEDACAAEAGRVSLDASDPEGYLNFLFPSREMYVEGDRSYWCLITTTGDDRFVGSVLAP